LGLVIDGFKEGSSRIADFTVLPKEGVWRGWLESHPKVLSWLKDYREDRQRKKRLREGMQYGNPDEPPLYGARDESELQEVTSPNIERIETEVLQDEEKAPDEAVLARRLAIAIRKVAGDFKTEQETKYSFEQWSEVVRLIRVRISFLVSPYCDKSGSFGTELLVTGLKRLPVQ
jgi:potassium channel subfamily K